MSTSDPPNPRFVVLRHVGFGPDHFDLMFESPAGVLVTYRADSWPPTVERLCTLDRIGDHRVDYLAYEGPVSGGRGTVRRVESGDYCTLLGSVDGATGEQFQVRLRGTGGCYTCEARKVPNAAGRWCLRPITEVGRA